MRLLVQSDLNARSYPACSNMAFVAYSTPEKAKEVVAAMNGKWVGQRCIIA